MLNISNSIEIQQLNWNLKAFSVGFWMLHNRNTHTHTHARTYARTHTHTDARTDTRTHTHTHTRAHTHTQWFQPVWKINSWLQLSGHAQNEITDVVSAICKPCMDGTELYICIILGFLHALHFHMHLYPYLLHVSVRFHKQGHYRALMFVCVWNVLGLLSFHGNHEGLKMW